MKHISLNPKSLFNSQQYGFSQAVITTGTKQVFLSGQVAVDENEMLTATSMYDQACKCLENIEKLLSELDADMTSVAMLRIYIRDDASSEQEQIEISNALNLYFKTHMPASSWVLVSGLSRPEWLLEIEAQAVIA